MGAYLPVWFKKNPSHNIINIKNVEDLRTLVNICGWSNPCIDGNIDWSNLVKYKHCVIPFLPDSISQDVQFHTYIFKFYKDIVIYKNGLSILSITFFAQKEYTLDQITKEIYSLKKYPLDPSESTIIIDTHTISYFPGKITVHGM